MAASPDATSRGWDTTADAYDRKLFPFTSLFAADALRALRLKPGAYVLDLAAGSGAFSLLAAREGSNVLAIDFSPAMIQRLQRRARVEGLDGIRTAVMDGQALDLPDDGFDAAASIFGLIFFPDRAAGFTELHRVLKPTGRVAVTAWSSPDRAVFVSVLRQAAVRAGVVLPPPERIPAIFSLADPEQFEREMTSAGFADVQVTRIFHTWDVPRPEDFFESVDGTSPVFAPTLALIGEKNLPAVKRSLVDVLKENYGTGPTRIPGEAWLGTGRKN